MNTKRQTIWLVSMLSLMVVLSAYYLFSDNPEELKMAADTKSPIIDDLVLESVELNPLEAALSAQVAGEQVDTDTQAVDSTVKSDEQIVEEWAARETMSSDYFTVAQLDRLEQLSVEAEQLMDIINNAESSGEAVTKAYETLSGLEDKQSKIMQVEEELMREYENAIVAEEDGVWQVTVKTDKLEKSQAVSIIDLLASEMNIAPLDVRVQYRQ